MTKLQALAKINLKPLEQYLIAVPPHFKSAPGEEAYALYANISQKATSKIADLGTYQGLSALALSINEDIHVDSYDITQEHNLVVGRDNITFKEGDIFNHLDEITKCDIILLDIDPHDGLQEINFYEALLDLKYKGTVFCDDINLNLGMRSFWNRVTKKKKDITRLGHHSGTGVIYFK